MAASFGERLFLLAFSAVLALMFGPGQTSAATAAGEAPRPNILLILADDLGRHQLGCYGSTYYETPTIDRLSSEGLRFLNAYSAAPICSPTRASLMTGLSPARLHLTDYIPGIAAKDRPLRIPDWQKSLPVEQVTIAERLRDAGYKTGIFGKWHLNYDKKYVPGRPGDPASQGFDSVLTTEKPNAGPPSPFPDDWHHTREITEATQAFLHENRERPFFCFVSFNAIHDPELERPELIEHFASKPETGGRNNPKQGAMLRRMDDAIGVILKQLDDLQLARNTVVVFFSDNGQKGPKEGAGFRGSKGDLYEGGICMPLIVRWPGAIAPGGVCDAQVLSDDFSPTFLELAGKGDHQAGFDGQSFARLLTNPAAKFERELLCWHYPHYHNLGIAPQSAIRMGRMKLIEWHERSLLRQPHPYELYDLEADPGESHDLAESDPATTAKLAARLRQWRSDVGAQMPELRK